MFETLDKSKTKLKLPCLCVACTVDNVSLSVLFVQEGDISTLVHKLEGEALSVPIWINIMEYGSTPYVGLTPIKHGRHTLAEILFSSEN